MTSVPPTSTYGEDQAMVLEQQSPEGAGRVEQGRREINQSSGVETWTLGPLFSDSTRRSFPPQIQPNVCEGNVKSQDEAFQVPFI